MRLQRTTDRQRISTPFSPRVQTCKSGTRKDGRPQVLRYLTYHLATTAATSDHSRTFRELATLEHKSRFSACQLIGRSATPAHWSIYFLKRGDAAQIKRLDYFSNLPLRPLYFSQWPILNKLLSDLQSFADYMDLCDIRNGPRHRPGRRRQQLPEDLALTQGARYSADVILI